MYVYCTYHLCKLYKHVSNPAGINNENFITYSVFLSKRLMIHLLFFLYWIFKMCVSHTSLQYHYKHFNQKELLLKYSLPHKLASSSTFIRIVLKSVHPSLAEVLVFLVFFLILNPHNQIWAGLINKSPGIPYIDSLTGKCCISITKVCMQSNHATGQTINNSWTHLI